jgi:Protein of unknown function (DUF3800)
LTPIDLFCDESAHLEHDGLPWIALGVVWCPHDKTHEIAVRLREIKARHGFDPHAEVKWTKVSPAKTNLYLDLLDYFLDDDDLHFRAVLVDKRAHDAAGNGGDHDAWYYALYFDLIEPLLHPAARFRIYLDIKDTRSQRKVQALHDVLCSSQLDFNREIVERVQQVRSHEVEQIQLADLLLGAVTYANRGLTSNSAKVALVHRTRERTGLQLTRTTLLREPKVNLYFWKPRSQRS